MLTIRVRSSLKSHRTKYSQCLYYIVSKQNSLDFALECRVRFVQPGRSHPSQVDQVSQMHPLFDLYTSIIYLGEGGRTSIFQLTVNSSIGRKQAKGVILGPHHK